MPSNMPTTSEITRRTAHSPARQGRSARCSSRTVFGVDSRPSTTRSPSWTSCSAMPLTLVVRTFSTARRAGWVTYCSIDSTRSRRLDLKAGDRRADTSRSSPTKSSRAAMATGIGRPTRVRAGQAAHQRCVWRGRQRRLGGRPLSSHHPAPARPLWPWESAYWEALRRRLWRRPRTVCRSPCRVARRACFLRLPAAALTTRPGCREPSPQRRRRWPPRRCSRRAVTEPWPAAARYPSARLSV